MWRKPRSFWNNNAKELRNAADANVAGNGSNAVTCTRSGNAFHPLTGATISANAPRTVTITVAGVTLTAYLVEPATTNALRQSNVFSNAQWIKTDITLTGSQADHWGGSTATLVTEGTAGTARIYNDVASGTTNRAVSYSIYLSYSNQAIVRIEVLDTSETNGFRGWFNLLTGKWLSSAAVGTGVVLSKFVEKTAIGWRVSINGTATTSAVNYRCSVQSASADAGLTPVNGAAYFVNRAQCEIVINTTVGIFAHSYAGDTTSSNVTRSAEVLTWVPPAPGSGDYEIMLFVWQQGHDSNNAASSETMAGNLLTVQTTVSTGVGAHRATCTDAGGSPSTSNGGATTYAQNISNQQAVIHGASYTAAGLKCWLDGINVNSATGTAPLTNPAASGIGCMAAGTQQSSSWQGAIAFNRELANTERMDFGNSLKVGTRNVVGVS